MKNIKLILSLVFITSLFACAPKYELKEAEDLEWAFIANSAPSFKGYYYLGSDDEYHYFFSKWDLRKDQYFKLNKNDFEVEHPLGLEIGIELKIDVHNSADRFGGSKYVELFVQEAF